MKYLVMVVATFAAFKMTFNEGLEQAIFCAAWAVAVGCLYISEQLEKQREK